MNTTNRPLIVLAASVTLVAWVAAIAASRPAAAASPSGERVEVELLIRHSAAVDGAWGPGDNHATMRIGVAYGETGAIFAGLGAFEDGRPGFKAGAGVSGTSRTAPAELERSRNEALARWPRVWQLQVRPLPAAIGKVELDVEWELWTAVRPGRGRREGGGTRHIALAEGKSHLLDAARDPGEDGGVTALEISGRVLADPRYADRRLRYEVWHEHTDAGGGSLVRLSRVVASTGEAVDVDLEPMRFPVPVEGAGREAVVELLNRLQGRLRDDGSIELLIATTRRMGLTRPGESATAWAGYGAGRKILSLQPGETIGIKLPPAAGVARQGLDDGGRSSGDFNSGATRGSTATVEDGTLVVDYARLFAGHTDEITIKVLLDPPGSAR